MLPSSYLKRGWTQRAMARTASGRSTYSDNDDAACWCISGSINAARHHLGISPEDYVHLRNYVNRLLQARGQHVSMDTWNDHPTRTANEVIALMEAAENWLQKDQTDTVQ